MKTHTKNRVNRAWPEDDPREYAKLSDAQKEALRAWIALVMRPVKTVGPSTSYTMKHDFERVGFYVTNGAFKGAMLAFGYEPAEREALNWRFRQRPTNKRAVGRVYYHALPDGADQGVARFKALLERVRAGRTS